MNRIIDAWMQYPTERMSTHEMFESLRCWTAWPSGTTPEMTITSMDRAGVSIGLASAWCAPDGWMISHEEVAVVAKAYPERIFGVAGANLYKHMEAVRELRRVIKEQGFKALRVLPWLWNLPPNGRRYFAVIKSSLSLPGRELGPDRARASPPPTARWMRPSRFSIARVATGRHSPSRFFATLFCYTFLWHLGRRVRGGTTHGKEEY